jgi:hypothetical protein
VAVIVAGGRRMGEDFARCRGGENADAPGI